MPERKHARAPEAVLARPLSLASYPVATGRPLPGHQRPRARKGDKIGLTRGPEINKPKSAEPVEQHRAAETNKSKYAAPASSAPTRQGIKRTSPPARNAGEKARPSPEAVLARPLSLASYPVATGRPLPGHQRPRARKGDKIGLTRARKSINRNRRSRSSSIVPPKPINQNTPRQLLRHPRAKG